MTFKQLVCLASLIPMLQACADHTPNAVIDERGLNEQLMDYNRNRVSNEDALIDSFVSSLNESYETSPTGMRYSILNEGEGLPFAEGDPVEVQYTIHLMDSTLCYDKREGEGLQFIVNGSDVAPGFHQLAGLLKPGGHVRAVWPSRLGYGLAGDMNRIPQDAVLLVELWIDDLR